MTFMIHNSTAGADALSGGGGGLGYRNLTPSSVFEFDVYQNSVDPDNNHIGYSEDGSSDVRPALETANPGYDINNGAEHFVWVDYDGGLDLLELYTSNSNLKPTTALIDRSVDLEQLLGGAGYFGFSAATGAAKADHDVLSFALTVDQPEEASVPAPPTLALLLIPALLMVAVRRNRLS